MTTRPAAQCDECQAIVLLDRERTVGQVPPGWHVVHGPTVDVDAGAADPRHDFCSLACLEAWVHQRNASAPIVEWTRNADGTLLDVQRST